MTTFYVCRCGSKEVGQTEERGAGSGFVCREWPKCIRLQIYPGPGLYCTDCNTPKSADYCAVCLKATNSKQVP